MKLLGICQVDHLGGPEIGLLRLVRRLAARGWEITLTSPGEVDEPPLALAGFPWEALPLGGLQHGAGARAVGSWPRARRLARDQDITYLNGTVAGRLLPALLGRTTVLHVHDIVDRVPRHWHGADLVLADSRAVGARLDPLDVHIVGTPVELEPASVASPWPEDGRPVVGFVGRLDARKGALDLCHAAPLVLARRPDARIVIIGDDPGPEEETTYAARVRAAEGVEHLGHVADVQAVMRHLDVLVLPSRQEPFGTVLGEAMAVGTPVVASDVDSLREVVQNGVTGLLVAPGDVPAIAAAILTVLDRRQAMGAAARAAARRFDADAYADDIEILLRRAARAG